MKAPFPPKVSPNALTSRVSIIRGLMLILAITLPSLNTLRAQTSLSVGDIQVLGVTSDANDSFSFVLWKDIAANTVIRFTDNSFTSAAGNAFFSGTEEDMGITFTSSVTAGSVIRYEDAVGLVLPGGVTASASGSLSGTSASGDQIFAYQGTAVSGTSFSGRTLLYGFNISDTSWTTGTPAASANNSFLPTAISGIDANIDSGNFDNADYTGTRTGMTGTAYRAAIANIANFTTQSDTRFNLATTGFTSTSALSLHWDANGTTAGNGGTSTWDTTTQSRFKNGASGTTYLHWVDSTTSNDHTAVFGGTAGAVSVAAGGVTASGLQFDTTGYTIQNNTVSLTGTAPVINATTGTSTISSTLAGSAGFTKSGTGTLSLTGANTISGDAIHTANAGTLSLGNVNALQNATLDTGAVGTQSVAFAVAGTNTYNVGGLKGTNALDIGGNTLSVGANNQSTEYSGGIAGTGGNLRKTGSGSLTLVGASSYSGTTEIQAGTLIVGNGGATGDLGGTSGVTNNATLEFKRSSNYTFGSVITGTGAVTQSGSGTTTLSAENSYSGGTSINAGALAVTNTTGSATGSGNVQAGSGSVILGTGIIAPASGSSVILGSGATVRVGNASGDTTGKILTFKPASGVITTTFQTGSIFEFDLFSGAGLGDQSGTASAADYFRTGGNLVIDSGVKLRVNSSMSGFAENDTWRLLDWNTLGGSAPTGTFNTALLELPALTSGLGWDLSLLYTAGTITVITVPEPARMAFIFIGLGCTFLRRRR